MAAPLETCTRDEQHSVICFLSSEGVKPTEIHRRIKTQYGAACLSLQQTCKWDRKLKNGVSSAGDADRLGWPHIACMADTVECVERVIQEKRHITTDEVALKLDISHSLPTILCTMFPSTITCVQDGCHDNSHHN
ncbi:hypothetical protein Cfor_07772 [Coptotermes formosanus]|uniref:Mos1 transposase HTH domain-containing protein n=1 Tax=Coptotermes formosanus TaxID=36987 RepID=A0A6L2PXR2_COPFO|nr:hypothetical protein Cfor_07772 [Coptotermes formosanus]